MPRTDPKIVAAAVAASRSGTTILEIWVTRIVSKKPVRAGLILGAGLEACEVFALAGRVREPSPTRVLPRYQMPFAPAVRNQAMENCGGARPECARLTVAAKPTRSQVRLQSRRRRRALGACRRSQMCPLRNRQRPATITLAAAGRSPGTQNRGKSRCASASAGNRHAVWTRRSPEPLERTSPPAG